MIVPAADVRIATLDYGSTEQTYGFESVKE